MTMPKHLQELRDKIAEEHAENNGYRYGFNDCYDAMSKMSEENDSDEVMDVGRFFKMNLETPSELYGGMTAIECAAKSSWQEVYGQLARMYGAYPNLKAEREKAIREVIDWLNVQDLTDQYSREWADRIEAKFLLEKKA